MQRRNLSRTPPQGFVIAFEKLMANQAKFTLNLSATELYMLIAQVQLATRHPLNVGPSRKTIERLSRGWTAELVKEVPEIGRYLAMGWDSSYDI